MVSSRSQLKWVVTATLAIAALWAARALAADDAAKGLEAFRKRDFISAARIFQEIAQQDPANARAWKLLGMSYAAEEKYD
ncbi:MAG: hypothetical protein M3Z85_11825, partial [Acidobacteriota bacterium]|nr:hypothetical protein [Acidobacteriota bacterium]